MLFPVMYIGAKLWRKTPIVRAKDMDFITDIAEIEAEVWDEQEPRNALEKFWQFIM